MISLKELYDDSSEDVKSNIDNIIKQKDYIRITKRDNKILIDHTNEKGTNCVRVYNLLSVLQICMQLLNTDKDLSIPNVSRLIREIDVECENDEKLIAQTKLLISDIEDIDNDNRQHDDLDMYKDAIKKYMETLDSRISAETSIYTDIYAKFGNELDEEMLTIVCRSKMLVEQYTYLYRKLKYCLKELNDAIEYEFNQQHNDIVTEMNNYLDNVQDDASQDCVNQISLYLNNSIFINRGDKKNVNTLYNRLYETMINLSSNVIKQHNEESDDLLLLTLQDYVSRENNAVESLDSLVIEKAQILCMLNHYNPTMKSKSKITLDKVPSEIKDKSMSELKEMFASNVESSVDYTKQIHYIRKCREGIVQIAKDRGIYDETQKND